MDDSVLAIYCLCDDLLKALSHQEDPQRQMSDAEVMTTAIVAARYFGGNFECARSLLAAPRYIPAMDYPGCRRAVSRRGIKVRIAGKGIDSSKRLGRHRWVVERTGSWLNCYRRRRIRYERLDDIHQAFLDLGCALICWNFLQQEF